MVALGFKNLMGRTSMVTNRNVVFLVIGALCAVVAILAYKVYEDNRQPKGVQLNIGPGGISLEKK
jgi:hypothetical protein